MCLFVIFFIKEFKTRKEGKKKCHISLFMKPKKERWCFLYVLYHCMLKLKVGRTRMLQIFTFTAVEKHTVNMTQISVKKEKHENKNNITETFAFF